MKEQLAHWPHGVKRGITENGSPQSLATFWGARSYRPHPSASRRRNPPLKLAHLFGESASIPLTIGTGFGRISLFGRLVLSVSSASWRRMRTGRDDAIPPIVSKKGMGNIRNYVEISRKIVKINDLHKLILKY
jgi:hypothetical protein